MELPLWVPLSIFHELETFRGADAAWATKAAKDLGPSAAQAVEARYMFFTDRAGLAWRGQPIASTLAETLEMYWI